MQSGSLQQRVGLFASTPLLTAVRVRANLAEQASSGSTAVRLRTGTSATAADCSIGVAAPPMFEPTPEWKEILPNQVLPAGLHIRVNLQTGKKEAKMLDK
ncbi:hypothetical protein PHYPSEUDO_008159 [Phytophthora pseudosyringae]|uniref:Uncharacterized protein n=1 Tax=Phytophthora pseudosyringae TaxID=221518 RepID=A0A8T1WAQ2_9STRA|nr:hypothetical protein PHYPSEUDO_008159 [Phytophthora pseudosyringae]